MFEKLMQLVQQGGQEVVINNPAVPNDQNEAVLAEAHNAITSGLQNLSANGGLNQLTQSVQNGQPLDNQHPAVQQISGNFADTIMQKFGLESGVAKSIAASMIPMILGKVMGGNSNNQQAGSTGSGFDLGGLLSSLTGGNSNTATGGGLMDKISSIGAKFGLDKDGDGDVDMDDLKKMI